MSGNRREYRFEVSSYKRHTHKSITVAKQTTFYSTFPKEEVSLPYTPLSLDEINFLTAEITCSVTVYHPRLLQKANTYIIINLTSHFSDLCIWKVWSLILGPECRYPNKLFNGCSWNSLQEDVAKVPYCWMIASFHIPINSPYTPHSWNRVMNWRNSEHGISCQHSQPKHKMAELLYKV